MNEIHQELEILEKQLKSQESVTNEEKLFAIREFWKNMQHTENMNDTELNKCYKEIIESILEERGRPSAKH